MTQYFPLIHKLILDKMEKGELNFESKEALKKVMEEYEIHTKVIEDQLEMCKKDHVDLRAEIARLVEENRNLYTRLKDYSENALYGKETSAPRDNSDAIDNLKQQLALALEEKETIEGLWKSSLKEVDALEEKLQHYQSGTQLTLVQSRLNDVQQDYTEAIKILESRQWVLKTENDQLTVKSELLANQLMQVTSQMALITEKNLSLNNSLKEATAQEQEWKSRYLNLEAKFIELDKSYQADKVKYAHTYEYEKVEAHLKEKLEGALRQRDELQTALERCHERMAELLRNAASDRIQVAEAVALVEGALQDREQALSKEASSAEEIKKMKTELNRLVEEAGLRVAQEAAIVKSQFDDQLTALKDQLQLVEQERFRKCVEVQQLKKECERLKALGEEGHKPHTSNKRDKHLEQVYGELQFTETECLQLRVENEALHSSITKLQDRCRKYSREKVKLKHELQNAEQSSQLYQHELAVTTQRTDLLTSQLNQTNLELAQLQSETIFQRESVTNAQAKVSVASTVELYKRLDDSYGQMNDKWRNEMNALTEKFETKLKKLKAKHKSCSREEDNVKQSDKRNNHC